jgi:hypothetical protein
LLRRKTDKDLLFGKLAVHMEKTDEERGDRGQCGVKRSTDKELNKYLWLDAKLRLLWDEGSGVAL